MMSLSAPESKQGIQRERMSNSVTQQVQNIRDKCLNALSTAFDQKITWLMQVLINISSKVYLRKNLDRLDVHLRNIDK